MSDTEAALKFLQQAGIFYEGDDDDDTEDGRKTRQTINLNDAFYWACSDSEYVEDSELPRVSELFWRYGIGGVYYWVAVEKRDNEVPQFVDVRRQIEFVRQEEQIRKDVPSDSARAFKKVQYTIGEVESQST